MISNDLLAEILAFRQKRDWERFHKPKELAISLSIEAGELLEIFQWKSNEEVAAMIVGKQMDRIQDEVADVAIVFSYLIHDLGIDLDSAVRSKLEKNETKYPVDKAYGNAKKYDEY